MRTTHIIFYAALTIGAFTSCDKLDSKLFGRTGSDAISIGKVSYTDPATKAADETRSQIALEDGSVFTIEKTVEPYTALPQTKADIKDADNLGSFSLYGYLDASEIAQAEGASTEDKSNNYFIPGANVAKGGDGRWHTEGNYYWRNNITHYFWAQSGASSMSTTENSATFTKTSDSEEDIILAYASKKWNEEMCNGHSGDQLDLNFKHALAAMTFRIGDITYQQKDKDGNISKLQEADRVLTGEISLIQMSEGSCTVDKSMNFNWDDLRARKAVTAAENETFFSIPQNDAALQIIYTDTYRTITRPVTVKLDEGWVEGHRYHYAINGKITVPKLEGEINHGIDLQFEKKNHKSEQVSSAIDVTYYKKIEVSWDNLPNPTGNGTFVMVYYGKDEKPLSYISDIQDNKLTPYLNDKEIIFIYDAFHAKTVKPEGGQTNNHCTCTIDIPEDMTGNINLYFAYRGGSANAATNWFVENLNIKVIEYK